MILGYLFTVGIFLGSFFNVVADRLPRGKTLNGRSKCDSCHHTLSWYDLIPLISYTLLSGKCRYCRASLSIQYPLSELATGVLFVLTWQLSTLWYRDFYLHLIHLAITSVIIIMVLSDLRYHILPDQLQIALIVFGTLRNIMMWQIAGGGDSWSALTFMGQALFNGAITTLPLLAIYLLTKGRGMGFGDVKLSFSFGYILGLWEGLGGLYIGFVVGGIIGGLLLLFKLKSLKSKVAFGPFLLLGFYSMLFWQYEIMSWVGKMYGLW